MSVPRVRPAIAVSSAIFALLLGASLAPADEIAVGGRVLLPGGGALPQAEVSLVPLADGLVAARDAAAEATIEPVARALSDPEGRFRLVAPCAGMWRVQVSAPGFVPVATALRPLLEPVELPALTLTPDEGLSVKLVDAEKRPVAGARVRVDTDLGRRGAGMGLWSFPTRWGTTGADGSVRLPRGRGERVVIAAAPSGFAYARRDGIAGSTVTLRLDRAAARPIEVRGDDGKPVASVAVFVGASPILVGRTDAKGHGTAIGGAAEVELALLADDGRRAEHKLRPPVPGKAAETEKVVLPARVAAAGRVIDVHSRRGVGGAIVWDASRPEDAAVADAAGGFVVAGPAGLRLDLVGGAPGFLLSQPYELQLIEDGRTGPAIPLRPAAAIEGRVVDADDRPIAGAELELKRRPTPGMMRIELGRAPRPTRALTDARGTFRLSPVDPEERWLVRTTAEGFAAAEVATGDLEAGRTRAGLKVVLDRGSRLVGTVVDADGNPLRDARVSAQPAADEPRMGMIRAMRAGDSGAAWTATTETDGRFAMAGVPAGRVDVEVTRDGFAKRKIGALEVPAGQDAVDLGEIVLAPGQKLVGTVLDTDGRPVEGVAVRLSEGGGPSFMIGGPGMGGDKPADALSDPAGWFRLDDLARDTDYNLRFERAGYVDAELRGVRTPRAEPLEVHLDPASDVGGRVVDPEGRPIAGARIDLTRDRTMQMGGNVMRMVMTENATSDAEGRFLFEDQEPGTIALKAVASGWQEARRDDIEVPRGVDVTDVELRLEAGAIVEGRVLAPDGRPAIGAAVRRVSESADPLPFGGEATDGNGHYRIEGLAPGTVSIEATHDDYPRTVKDLEARAGINALDLYFTGGQEVSGRVLDVAGNPVADASVRLAAAGRMLGGPETTSAGDGSFRMPGVRDGDWKLWVASAGFAPSPGDIQVHVEGQPVTGLEVRLDPGATITGSVRGLSADDLSRAEVRAQGRTPTFETYRVDPTGRFRIERLLPGAYTVIGTIAGTGRQARGQVVIEDGVAEATVDLEFGGGITLSGRAMQAERAVAGATVFAQGTDVDRTGSSETDHEGHFAIEGLEPGRYRVQLQHFASGLSHVEEFEVATSREVLLEVPSAHLSGRVLDAADRQPLAGVQLVLLPTGGAADAPAGRRVTTTDVDGKFRLDAVADGAWSLNASRQGYAAVTQPVTVHLGRDVEDLRLALDATEGVVLEARLPGGGIPDELRLAVLDPSGQPLVAGSFATGEGGRVRLTTVPPGAWDLLVSGAGSAVTRITVRAPGPVMQIALMPACRLEVSVPELAGGAGVAFATLADASGLPFRNLDWSGTPRGEWRLSGGRIEFGSLPPGSWTVRVNATDARSWQGTATTADGVPAALVLD